MYPPIETHGRPARGALFYVVIHDGACCAVSELFPRAENLASIPRSPYQLGDLISLRNRGGFLMDRDRQPTRKWAAISE